MENAPHITFVGRNVPANLAEKYFKWNDGAYAPTYVKVLGASGIDRYQIIRESLDYPNSVLIYHRENRKGYEELIQNPTRDALQKDYDATFYRLEWFWHDVFALMGTFRKESSAAESTIVEDAPVIHIEGYRIPSGEQGKYEQWFMKWFSHVYAPILIKSPGLKAYNCFKLSGFSMRWPDRIYVNTEIPPYISILYFDNIQAFDDYRASPEYMAFKRNLELEFAQSMTTVWDVEYQVVKSWRK
jgi:hypothetical protein